MSISRRNFAWLAAVALLTAALVAQADEKGFIYGKLTTRNGETYTGVMRWGSQECFWDDLFNADKDENPWKKYAQDDLRRERHRLARSVEVFGMTIGGLSNQDYTHPFIVRFGDIQRIDAHRHNRSIVTLKSGTEYEISGSGDVGETIQLVDDKLGKININWDEIRDIEFQPTPVNARTTGYRLSGKIKTRSMDFRGFIMWDAEECLSSDLLDGESEVGEMSIEFGNIHALKRVGGNATMVTLKDGRDFKLRGTNDVNSDNRGIYVQDERYGKINVPWDEFVEIVYDDERDSGSPYDDYKAPRELQGTVKRSEGEEVRGRIVYDLDEAETGDILNGNLDQMEFNIPFEKIASITPQGSHASTVRLAGGEVLRLEEAQDVTDNHSGLLIFKSENNPQYVAWDDVEKITFSK